MIGFTIKKTNYLTFLSSSNNSSNVLITVLKKDIQEIKADESDNQRINAEDNDLGGGDKGAQGYLAITHFHIAIVFS